MHIVPSLVAKQFPCRQSQPAQIALLGSSDLACAETALLCWRAYTRFITSAKNYTPPAAAAWATSSAAEQLCRGGRTKCSICYLASRCNDASAGLCSGRRSPHCRFYRPVPVPRRGSTPPRAAIRTSTQQRWAAWGILRPGSFTSPVVARSPSPTTFGLHVRESNELFVAVIALHNYAVCTSWVGRLRRNPKSRPPEASTNARGIPKRTATMHFDLRRMVVSLLYRPLLWLLARRWRGPHRHGPIDRRRFTWH